MVFITSLHPPSSETYVKPLWEVVEKICDSELTFDKILGIEECYSQDRILTLISFLIYKEWLLLSLDNKKRHSNIKFDIYKNELDLRLKFMRQVIVMTPMKLNI